MTAKIIFRKNQVWSNGENNYLTVYDVNGDCILMKEAGSDNITEWSYDSLMANDNIVHVGNSK